MENSQPEPFSSAWYLALEPEIRKCVASLNETELQYIRRLCAGETYTSISTGHSGSKNSGKSRFGKIYQKFNLTVGVRHVALVSLLMLPPGHPWKKTIMLRNGWLHE